MLNNLLAALWFFWPAGHANMMPVFAAKIPALKRFAQPIDGGRMLHGKRLFGDHKTWRGFIFAFLATIPLVWAQVWAFENWQWIRDISYIDYSALNILQWSFLMSFGALGGDLIKSFFKRRVNVAPGESWFPFDQLDYVFGGLIASMAVIRLSIGDYVLLVVVWFVAHLITVRIGHQINLRDQPI